MRSHFEYKREEQGRFRCDWGDKRFHWLSRAAALSDKVTVCAPLPPLSALSDCVPFWSSWTLQRGLLEPGCSRPFKLWLKLQRTNNKSETVRSRGVRPRADALKWGYEILIWRDQMEGEKKDSERCKAAAEQTS